MIVSDHFISLNTNLTAIFRIISSKYQLSFSQYCIIMKIDYSGTPMSGLASQLGLDKSTLTRNIAVLINRNLVNKNKDSTDLRIKKVVLTEEGEKLKNNLYADLDDFSLKLLNSFDSKLKDEICLLDKLVQKLDSYVPKR